MVMGQWPHEPAAVDAYEAFAHKLFDEFAQWLNQDRGLAAETIAGRAHLSLATVRSHIRSILVKLDVSSQLAAVALAHRVGWSPDTESDELLCVAASA
jgi:hypothetical protein